MNDNPAETTSTEQTTSQTPPPANTEGSPLTSVEAPPFTPVEVSALKLPDGFTLDETTAKSFLEITNGSKLPADKAQALVNLQVKFLQDAETAAEAAWNAQQTEWKKQIGELPGLGGANLPATEAACAKVLDKFGTPELRTAFDVTGIGNHPEMVKMLNKIAAALTEGALITGDNAPGRAKSQAERLYYKSQSNTE